MEDTFALAWKHSEWGEDARKERNRRARELRRDGYEVNTVTLDFTDLARDVVYELEAHVPGTPRPPFGCSVSYVHREPEKQERI